MGSGGSGSTRTAARRGAPAASTVGQSMRLADDAVGPIDDGVGGKGALAGGPTADKER